MRRFLFLGLPLLLGCGASADEAAPEAAQAPVAAVNTVFIEEMTWTEIREAIDNGTTTIVLATAGTEQNGPHMVMGKHKYIVEAAAERIARSLRSALVAPVITYVPEGEVDPPSGHMRMAGSITLPNEFFMKLVEYAARSLRVHGFTDIVFIGDSGGNQRGMETVANELNAEWGEGDATRIHFIGDYYSANNAFMEWLIERGETEETVGRHAGMSDTSILLHVAPQYIRQDKLAPGGGFEGSGVSGDPSRASAEYGRVGLEMKVEAALAQIRASMLAR